MEIHSYLEEDTHIDLVQVNICIILKPYIQYYFFRGSTNIYDMIYYYYCKMIEDDDDSGADSLNDQSLQSSLCGDSSGGGPVNSNNRTNTNSRSRNARYRLQQSSNMPHQGGYPNGRSGSSRALVPYSTELVPVLTSNCNCNMNVPSQQGCLLQQHMNPNTSGSGSGCGHCFHLQCQAPNSGMMNSNALQIPLSVERRLMQLEGDKDTLQLQVYSFTCKIS